MLTALEWVCVPAFWHWHLKVPSFVFCETGINSFLFHLTLVNLFERVGWKVLWKNQVLLSWFSYSHHGGVNWN